MLWAELERREECTTMVSYCSPETGSSYCTQAPARRDGAAAAERAVLTAISGVTGRGKSGLSDERLADFEDAIARLEADGGVQVWTLPWRRHWIWPGVPVHGWTMRWQQHCPGWAPVRPHMPGVAIAACDCVASSAGN